MTSKQGLLPLLLMALLFHCIHHLSATSPVENMKENDQERGTATAHHNKLSHGNIGGGGNGGNPAVSGGASVVSGGNGGSHSPNIVQGGGGVTPLYAAGAGNNRHPHRGGGNRSKGRTGLETLAITTFAWFLLCVKYL